MLLLRKYMSLIGVGSARIDLILPKLSYQPGESICGYFNIEGGTIDQQIKRIECDLVMTDEMGEQVIDSSTILTSKRIESDECNHMPFHFSLPEALLPSAKKRSYRFKTRMIFNEGVKSADLDEITIVRS
ncbi:sporulation protein [Bacillus infantis]|uniref:sporulation protein n=1 Tax=Bacillus infantis TaxID=324767 RepID=UPI003CE78F65